MLTIARYSRLIAGLFLYALGVMLTVSANLGLAPWDVLAEGVSRTISITFGQSIILVGLIILVALALFRERLGIGTILNMLLIGSFADLIRGSGLLPKPEILPLQILTMLIGLFVIAFGAYVYIGAGLCTGPRDGLMVLMRKKTRLPVGVCRALIEGCALLLGYLLGGTVGIGTLISVTCVGFAIQLTFRLLNFRVEDVKHEDLAATLRLVKSSLKL